VPVFPKMREHSFEMSSVKVGADMLPTYDCVLVATDHDAFDYELILRHAQLIVDTRGRFLAPASNVVKA